MTTKTEIKVTTRWDKDVVPANEPRKRGLIVEISAKGEARKTERRDVNLALVIDRSGSMARGKIEAAKEAAIGVVEHLGENDVLSVVDFDSEITTLIDGVRLTGKGRKEAVRAIGRLHARSMTNLAGGWLEGATLAADVMERLEFKSGHIVLLSDGHANVGIQDPTTLRAHAEEMASRGVTTSTVGVGNGYSPLQLEALSEGGLGRLHDAASPEEIIETILGELGEVISVVATDVEMHLKMPAELRAEMLANFRTERVGNNLNMRLGHLIDGSKRTVPFIIDVPALPEGRKLDLEFVITGRHGETREPLREIVKTATLRVVPPIESQEAERDRRVAEQISLLWESTMGLEAMRLNELGDFVAASNMVRDVGPDLAAFSAQTGAEKEIRGNLRRMEDKVQRRWDGRSKRESMVAALKYSKGERDHRSNPRGKWSDHL